MAGNYAVFRALLPYGVLPNGISCFLYRLVLSVLGNGFAEFFFESSGQVMAVTKLQLGGDLVNGKACAQHFTNSEENRIIHISAQGHTCLLPEGISQGTFRNIQLLGDLPG